MPQYLLSCTSRIRLAAIVTIHSAGALRTDERPAHRWVYASTNLLVADSRIGPDEFNWDIDKKDATTEAAYRATLIRPTSPEGSRLSET